MKKSAARIPTSATTSPRATSSMWRSPARPNHRAACSEHTIEKPMIDRNRASPTMPELGQHLEIHVVRDLRRVDDELVALDRAGLEQVVDRGDGKLPEPMPRIGLSSTIRQPTFQMSVRPLPPSTVVIRSRASTPANEAK